MKMKLLPAALMILLPMFGFLANFEAHAQARAVVLYEGGKQTGISRKYYAGNYYLGGAEAFDNRASSIAVPDGYSVAVCDASQNPAYIKGGKTPGGCVRFPEGFYDFHGFDKKATYIVVEQFEDRTRNCVVCLYSGVVQRGYVKRYNEAGTFPVAEFIGYSKDLDGNKAPLLGNTASSLWVAPGYTAIVKSLGVAKTFQSGASNLPADFNNNISEIIIKKNTGGSSSPQKNINPNLIKVKPKPFQKRNP